MVLAPCGGGRGAEQQVLKAEAIRSEMGEVVQGSADGGEFGIRLNDSGGSQVAANGWKNGGLWGKWDWGFYVDWVDEDLG